MAETEQTQTSNPTTETPQSSVAESSVPPAPPDPVADTGTLASTNPGGVVPGPTVPAAPADSVTETPKTETPAKDPAILELEAKIAILTDKLAKGEQTHNSPESIYESQMAAIGEQYKGTKLAERIVAAAAVIKSENPELSQEKAEQFARERVAGEAARATLKITDTYNATYYERRSLERATKAKQEIAEHFPGKTLPAEFASMNPDQLESALVVLRQRALLTGGKPQNGGDTPGQKTIDTSKTNGTETTTTPTETAPRWTLAKALEVRRSVAAGEGKYTKAQEDYANTYLNKQAAKSL